MLEDDVTTAGQTPPPSGSASSADPAQPDSAPFSPGWFLVELTSLDDLSFPASTSKRVKFTCVTASPRNLVLATTSGSVYVFSRYRQKSRLATPTNLPPVDVFVAKDGTVNTLLVSPNEQLIGVGSESGRVSVASVGGVNGQQTTVVYTVPGDARRPDRVTALAWAGDSKSLIVGHASGLVQLHRIATRSVFRSSHEVICRLEGEVVQLDWRGQRSEVKEAGRLLISTTTASHVHEMETGTSYQVGKKSRNSRMGACFLRPREDVARDTASDTDFVVASRPNGRMWEANAVGVVYRTHQFRQSTHVPRCHVVSFRKPFEGSQSIDEEEGLQTAVNLDVNLFQLQRIAVNGDVFLVTWYGTRVMVLDAESSQIVLLSDLTEEIISLSVCGSDIFVLFNGSTFLKKFTLFSRHKAVEKLQLRGCHMQAAQLILYTSKDVEWSEEVIKTAADGLAANSGSKRRLTNSRSDSRLGRRDREKRDRLRERLYELWEKKGAELTTQSQYDNCQRKEDSIEPASHSSPLLSGVHRVHCVKQEKSGYEDDFSFRLPVGLREKSSSSPSVETGSAPSGQQRTTHTSMPSTDHEVEGCSRNGTPDVTRQDILMRARHILESDGRVVEADSLRTLLQLESPDIIDDVLFVPTVTVSNVAKSLAELAMTSPIDVPQLLKVDRKQRGKGTKRTGPTIVKAVRPRRQAQTVVRSTQVAITPPPVPTQRTIEMVSTVVNGTVKQETRRETASSGSDDHEPNSNLIENLESEYPIKSLSPPHLNDLENNLDAEIQSRIETEWLEARLGEMNSQEESKQVSPRRDVSRTSLSSESATTTVDSAVAGDEREEVAETQIGRDNCTQCGVHRSWIGVALMSSVCRRVAVLQYAPELGSIPRSISDWSRVFSVRLAPSSSHPVLCPRCEMGLATAGKVAASLRRSAGLFPEGSRLPAENIRERIAESDEERLRRALFGGERKIKRDTPDNAGTSPSKPMSNGCPTESVTVDPELPENSAPTIPEATWVVDPTKQDLHLAWLVGVSMKTLLFLCYLVLGHRDLMSLIRQTPPLLEGLGEDEWAFLVALTIHEHSRGKQTVDSKVVHEVLESVSLSDWLSHEAPPLSAAPPLPSSPRNSLSRRQALPIYSWLVDCNGFCPLCTLPLQTTVDGQSLRVTSFSCGHAYHSSCLATRIFCVACRARARKSAATARGAKRQV